MATRAHVIPTGGHRVLLPRFTKRKRPSVSRTLSRWVNWTPAQRQLLSPAQVGPRDQPPCPTACAAVPAECAPSSAVGVDTPLASLASPSLPPKFPPISAARLDGSHPCAAVPSTSLVLVLVPVPSTEPTVSRLGHPPLSWVSHHPGLPPGSNCPGLRPLTLCSEVPVSPGLLGCSGPVGGNTAPALGWRSNLSLHMVGSGPPPTLTPHWSPGFVQVSGDTRLVAVEGPVPSQPSCCEGALELPVAFTSTATHFKPIVLTPASGAAR